MSLNGQNRIPGTEDVDPAHIVPVQDFSSKTLRSIIDHLKVSTDFEHLVYREAELDAIWTITGFFLANEADSSRREAVKDLHACVHKAHDLVADRRPAAAAMLLQAFL
jgi:hypothetical protein